MSRLLIIENILTNDRTIVCFIYNLYITMTFSITIRTIVDNIIAFNILLWGSDSRASIKFHLVSLAIISTIIGMYNFALSSLDNRLTNNMNKTRFSVTMRFRCCNTILRRKHDDITKEVSIVSLRIVITLISNNRVAIVNQCTTSTKIVCNL